MHIKMYRYFPEGIFPSGIFPRVVSKWQLPKGIFSSGNFTNV